MRKGQALPSNYIGKDDVLNPIPVKVRGVRMESVKSEHGNENKPVLYITGFDRGMILNNTNWDTLEELSGNPDSDAWKGLEVVVYTDPNVMFGSKRVGGLRIRPVKAEEAEQSSLVSDEPPPPTDDDYIPTASDEGPF